MVPDYCVGQSLEYLKARGFTKNDFTAQQLEDEKRICIDFYKDHAYENFYQERMKSQGYKLKKVQQASGTYEVWSKD